MSQDFKRKIIAAIKRGLRWADRHVPAGVRSLLGVLLMVAGVLGFLPVLGFWMLPLGACLIALDIPPLRRRVMAWQRARSGPAKGSGPHGEREGRDRG